eukprot:5235192-Prymnesium_polylepis.1
MANPKKRKKRKKPCEKRTARSGQSSCTSMRDMHRAHTFCRTAESKILAGRRGQIARLDHEHARVEQDEGQVQQRCQRFVVLT